MQLHRPSNFHRRLGRIQTLRTFLGRIGVLASTVVIECHWICVFLFTYFLTCGASTSLLRFLSRSVVKFWLITHLMPWISQSALWSYGCITPLRVIPRVSLVTVKGISFWPSPPQSAKSPGTGGLHDDQPLSCTTSSFGVLAFGICSNFEIMHVPWWFKIRIAHGLCKLVLFYTPTPTIVYI